MSEQEPQSPEVPVDEPGKDPEQAAPEPIDPVLANDLQSLKLLVKLDNLLKNGSFPGGAAADLILCEQFLKNLHEPILHKCQQNPDWEKATKKPLTDEDKAAIAKAEEKRNRKERRAQGH